MLSREADIAHRYMLAKRAVLAAGFDHEIDWQDSVRIVDTTEQVFLREAAWVVLCSGMRENVVRSKFPAISQSFFGWHSSHQIAKASSLCRSSALEHFANIKKVDAIITICSTIAEEGVASILRTLQEDGPSSLTRLPFLGPITSIHLAKNLGLAIAKPDRHLVRAAEFHGFPSPESLCSTISDLTGDSIAVVDIVLWRYAATWKDLPLERVLHWFISEGKLPSGDLTLLRSWLRGELGRKHLSQN